MRTPHVWRYSALGLVFAAVGVMLIYQLFRIQFNPQADAFIEQGDLYAGEWRLVSPPRGQIYDRWGHLLAGNRTVYEIGVELAYVEDPRAIAFALNGLVGAEYNDVLAAASQEASDTAIYATLADNVSADKVALLREYINGQEEDRSNGRNLDSPSLNGLVFRQHLQRSYPEKDLASSVLGFVNAEGAGFFGIEEQYDDLLAGIQQRIWFPSDPNRVEEMPEIPAGASLVLTIDRELQAEVERILDAAVEAAGAKAGTVVIMHPQTGEILAMTSTPRLDLNEYWRYPELYPDTTPFNRAVSQSYEPGSVFKVITMASALEVGAVEPGTQFLDTGFFQVGGITIRNWDGAAWGQQDMLGCMQKSLNVCLAWVGGEMGADNFYTMMERFGMGRPTGVDLASEASGRLKIPGDGDWYPADLGTNTFGQGISATPIQMLMAISAVANEGQMVSPHVVKAIIDNGTQYEIQPQIAESPISIETATTLNEMLAESLENEASTALVTGYRVAGKTGTAEIPTPQGYTRSITNASFVGWGPVDDPQFIVYIWIEEPGTSIWGSIVAAPIFNQIVERMVVLLDIPPDAIRTAMLEQES